MLPCLVYVGAGDGTQGVRLVQQALCEPNHLPSLYFNKPFYFNEDLSLPLNIFPA